MIALMGIATGWRMNSALLTALALLSLTSVCGTSLADDPPVQGATENGAAKGSQPRIARAIVPIFGRVLSIKVPPGFVPGNEEAHDPVYILELIDEHGTLRDWSEMITMKGWRGSAQNPKSTTTDLLRYIIGGIQMACKKTFAATEPESIQIDAVPAIQVMAGCGSAQLPGMKPFSEIAMIAVFKAGNDFYTVQRAIRGSPMDGAPQFDAKALTDKFAELGPIAICKPSDGVKSGSDPCLYPSSSPP